MRIPTLEGVIRRRILVNYRVDSGAIERQLPVRFKPKLHRGYAIAGICLIRLERLRPRNLPALIGLSSENAAHRVAVTWTDSAGVSRDGVYIWRRDSDSRLNQWAGGVLFPGEHHRASFLVDENATDVVLRARSVDGVMNVQLVGKTASSMPANSIFDSLESSSAFFAAGSLGYSPTRNPCRFDGLHLEVAEWQVEPFDVSFVESSFFCDTNKFPQASVQFDHALIMRNLAHRWRGAEDLDVA